jgi:hypothetical protein
MDSKTFDIAMGGLVDDIESLEKAVDKARAEIDRLREINAELLAALKDIVPPMPPADAICHNGICAQENCAHCRRVAAAVAAIRKAEGRS